MKRPFVIAAIIIGLPSCSQSHAQLTETATAFQAGAERCLLRVRDGREQFDDAAACQALSNLSQAYINAGGARPGEPAEISLIAEQARTMAWMARAISASDDPSISLW